jgi:hypothetical protein
MRVIHMYLDLIDEELDGAKEYAERYLEYKSSKPQWSKMCAEMASDELKHSEYIKEIATQTMNDLPWVPAETKDRWDTCMRHYGERVAMVRLMLSK